MLAVAASLVECSLLRHASHCCLQVVDLLPLAGELHMHRFVAVFQVFALLLAGLCVRALLCVEDGATLRPRRMFGVAALDALWALSVVGVVYLAPYAHRVAFVTEANNVRAEQQSLTLHHVNASFKEMHV